MILKSTLESRGGLAFLLILVSAANAAWAQIAIERKHSKKNSGMEDLSALTRPQLLNADSNPTLRYPVMNMSGNSIFSLSYGWFDVDHKGIRYTVVQPDKKKNESYECSFNDLTQVKMWRNFLEFRHAKDRERIIYLSQDRWGSVHTGPGLENAANTHSAETLSIARTMTNFDGVLAVVKPPAPPAPIISLRADPGTVEKGHSVTLVWTSANATALDLEPGGGQVAVAGSTSLSPADSTTYTLTATGPGGTRTATAYVLVTKPPPAVPPTVVLVEPSGAGAGQAIEVTSSPLTIRGVAMDNSGIPAVTINGAPVDMRPKSAQAAEFSSDPITLHPGDNKFEVNATNAAHAVAKVEFIARYTPPPPPAPSPTVEKPQPAVETNSRGLDKADIIDLLKGDVSSARVTDLVKDRGIKFVPTQEDLKEIRAAGGEDDLVNAINDAAASPTK
jgi:hypothetical protein